MTDPTSEPRRRTGRRKASTRLPQRFDLDAPLFLISTAARLAVMHPQTLRTYDRLGLVVPKRASGRGRRYSMRDVQRLRLIQHLSQDEGINLVGVRQILDLQAEVETLQLEVVRLTDEVRTLRRLAMSGRVFTASSDGVWLRASRPPELLA